MSLKINKFKFESYVYLAILIFYSGNPVVFSGTISGQFIFVAISVILIIRNINLFNNTKASIYYVYIISFILVFIFQRFSLGFITYVGALGLLLKVTLGYIVVRYIGAYFPLYFFKAIYFISLISLLFFGLNSAGIHPPTFVRVSENISSLIIYTQNADGMRNSGLFWEPGAFACYIILSFLLYTGNIKKLFKKYKNQVVVLVITLGTTFSTTGYIVFFFFITVSLILEYRGKSKILIFPIVFLLLAIGYFSFKNIPFLQSKMEHQLSTATELQGEFSNSRFGALAFDMHYIKKHPLFGNGMHQSTRYIDHPWLKEQALGHGNGFSNFLATMGLFLIFIYYYLLAIPSKKTGIILILSITALLQGEQLLNFPLFLSIPFIVNYCSSIPRGVQHNSNVLGG